MKITPSARTSLKITKTEHLIRGLKSSEINNILLSVVPDKKDEELIKRTFRAIKRLIKQSSSSTEIFLISMNSETEEEE
jgi:hypothetical protein